VLLVIFMAALPLTQKGLDINLPAVTQQAQQQQVDSSQIVLEMSADRQMSVNNQVVGNLSELETRLRSIFEQRQEKTMFIAAAGTLRYGEIVAVIDAAKGAGVETVGIVTEGMRRAAGVQPGNSVAGRDSQVEQSGRPPGEIQAAIFCLPAAKGPIPVRTAVPRRRARQARTRAAGRRRRSRQHVRASTLLEWPCGSEDRSESTSRALVPVS
jgi:biopolymer transport protein ExbD